jgi:hypothetical protein
VLQVKLKLDGERVLDAECVIGFLHRGVEKLGEAQTYGQFVPTLDRIDYIPGEKKGTNPDGTSCFGFGLRPVFRNTGVAGTGPFKIVWERATAQQGPFTPACEACTMIIPDAPPGAAMIPEQRLTSSCQGYRWFRVRLDSENVVIEFREDNNSLVNFH